MRNKDYFLSLYARFFIAGHVSDLVLLLGLRFNMLSFFGAFLLSSRYRISTWAMLHCHIGTMRIERRTS